MGAKLPGGHSSDPTAFYGCSGYWMTAPGCKVEGCPEIADGEDGFCWRHADELEERGYIFACGLPVWRSFHDFMTDVARFIVFAVAVTLLFSFIGWYEGLH